MAGLRALGRRIAVLAALSGAAIAVCGAAAAAPARVRSAHSAPAAIPADRVWQPPEHADWMWELGEPLVTSNSA